MARRRRLLAGGAVCAAVAALLLFRADPTPAQPRPDLRPLAHWVFEPDVLAGKTVADRATGRLPGTVLGAPKLAGPPHRLELDGPDDGVLIRERVTPKDFLPKAALTAVAWVRVDEPGEWGGVVGCFQDNGPKEAGFVLGYTKTGFLFGLATHGRGPVKDGFGTMSSLKGATAYEPGRWYHVAGVYDGKQMRLYVNGRLDGTSDEQSGDILYAPAAPLILGRYRDADEDFPLVGALKEVMLCPHAVPADQLAAHFAADRVFADLPPSRPAGPKFTIEPYLQAPAKTGMTVMWETDAPCTAVVEYGTTFPPTKQAKVEKADTLGEVALTGLTPGTRYFYRVVAADAEGRKRESRNLTFTTAVEPGHAFSFTVVGDTQRNPAVTGKIAKLMWERRPHFVVHCGDVVDDGAAKWMWTGDLFKPSAELFGRVPVFPCIGNHEKNHAHYYRYFSLPAPDYHYSYRYGDAEFFVLDTNTNRSLGLLPGGEQYRWLDAALAKSDARWKFCYHHHPVFSSDSNDYGDTAKEATAGGDRRVRPLQVLYEKHGVDVVFNGHIHLYERTWPVRGGKVDRAGGVTHVTTGGGGGRLEDFGPTPLFFQNQLRVDFHFCQVSIHQGELEFRAFDQDGRLFDHFERRKD